MKRKLIPIVSILVVLTGAWAYFARAQSAEEGSQRDSQRRNRREMWRQEELKAISAIEEQLAEIRSALESIPEITESWRDLSEEERDKLRQRFMEMREKRQKSMAVIEEQIDKLKGSRQLREELEQDLEELKAIRELAAKENATETVARIENLIAEREKQFEDNMQKLGMQRQSRRQRD